MSFQDEPSRSLVIKQVRHRQQPDSATGGFPKLGPLVALLVATGILYCGQGLVNTLVPIRLNLEGFSAAVVGIVSAAYFAGFVAGARYFAAFIRSVGHIRSFAGFAAIVSVLTLFLPLLPNPAAWTLLRFLHGVCIGGLIMAIESWLNAATPKYWRGRILAFYTFIVYVGIGGGQFLLNLYETSGFELFSVGAMFFTFSLVPVALSRVEAPPIKTPLSFTLKELIAVSPVAIVGSFGAGLILGSFYGLGPLYGERIGLATREITLLMGITILGGLCLQWPIGYLSDHVDRRKVILGMSAAAGVISLFIAVAGQKSLWLLFAVLAVFGGTSFTLYPISLALAADLLEEGEDMTSVSTGLLLFYGIGATVGPLAAGQVLESVGSAGLFLFTGVVMGGVAALSIRWIVARPAVAPEERGAYVAVPPRSSPVVFELDPRVEESPEQNTSDVPPPTSKSENVTDARDRTSD